MSIDLFEQLAQHEIPPPPDNLTGRVHERLNKTLFFVHVAEFALAVLPYAALLLARGVWSLLHLTLTGRHAVDRTPRSPDDGRNE